MSSKDKKREGLGFGRVTNTRQEQEQKESGRDGVWCQADLKSNVWASPENGVPGSAGAGGSGSGD